MTTPTTGDTHAVTVDVTDTNDAAHVTKGKSGSTAPLQFDATQKNFWKAAPTEARYALGLLFWMNMFNYIDRFVPSAAKSLFQKELGLSDVETALPLTAFIIVFMLTAPIFSYLTERGYPRKWLIALGVASWSVATSTAALANNYAIFIISRAFIGVGEAAYATIAPALLSDYWPSSHRNAMLSFFYLAIPVGAAAGFGIGGLVGEAAGWRVAFIVCGTPGIILALMALKIREPPRGCQESVPEILLAMEQKSVTIKEALMELPRNAYYCYVVGGMTFVIFASGGMADWFPEWLHREHDVTVGFAGLVVGGVTVIGGIGGIVVGAYASSYLRSRVRNAYLCVCWIGLAIAALFGSIILSLPKGTSVPFIAFLLLICQIALWAYIGPANSLLANCVPARLRTRGFGVSILVTHGLGDAISPTIIGAISGASSLPLGLLLVPATFACGSAVWFIGWWRLETLSFEKQVTGIEMTEKPSITPLESSADVDVGESPITPVSPVKLQEHRASLLRPGVVDSTTDDKTEAVVAADHTLHVHALPTMTGTTPIIILEEETVTPVISMEHDHDSVNNRVAFVSGVVIDSGDGTVSDPTIGRPKTGSVIDTPELRNRHHTNPVQEE